MAIILLTKTAQPQQEVGDYRELHGVEEAEKQPTKQEERQEQHDDVVREMLQVILSLPTLHAIAIQQNMYCASPLA